MDKHKADTNIVKGNPKNPKIVITQFGKVLFNQRLKDIERLSVDFQHIKHEKNQKSLFLSEMLKTLDFLCLI